MSARFVAVVVTYAALVAPLAVAQKPGGSLPDVYLVTIDTLRADHIHCYGDVNIQTPALDALARDGVRFTEAFTPSPLTNTSHTSILTGLLPSVHGVTDFGIPLAKAIPTWALLLQQNGYQTAAFIGAVVLDAQTLSPGLDHGFDYYDNFPKDAPPGSHWGRVERRGEDVVHRAEAWMDAHPAKPRYVWVHLYDPHDPYEPPPPFAQIYKDHLYDGEIAYADQALGQLVAYLQRGDRYREALIIVVGDHGEGLGEHGEQTHGIFLYDATTHVPLLIKPPLPIAAGTVVTAQVQTTDILPTVLDVLHLDPPVSLAHRSLLPYFAGAGKEDRVVFGETDYPLRFGWAPLRAVRSNGFQLIEAPQPELYNVAQDPGELKNTYEPGKKTVVALRAALAASPMKPVTMSSLPDPKTRIGEQNLVHTAMMQADQGHAAEARATLAKVLALDPGLTVASRQLGELAFQAGDYSTAADRFRRVLAAQADDAPAALYEAKALQKLGDVRAARSVLEALVTRSPDQLEGRNLLATLDAQAGDRAAAEDQFEAVILLDAHNHDALLGLAQLQLAEKKFGDVVELLEPQVKASAPTDLTPLLIQAYFGLGRTADAEKLQRPN